MSTNFTNEGNIISQKRNNDSTHNFTISPEEINVMLGIYSESSSKLISYCKKLGGKGKIIKGLLSDEKNGINSNEKDQMKERIKIFGTNKAKKIPYKTLWQLIYEQLKDNLLRLLIIAATVSLFIGLWREGLAHGWIDGMAIYIAVLLIISVSSCNNYIKGKQFRKLQESREERAVPVIRNGAVIEINIHDILVGDILLFSQGELMPVDALLLSGNKVQVDESSMTGESEPITKISLNDLEEETHDPFLISGSKIVDGNGTCIVIAVGENSSMGKIFEAIEKEDEMTPLQKKLEVLVEQIGKIGISAAIISMLAILINVVFKYVLNNKPFLDSCFLSELLNIFIIGITITVVVVPEGLPLAVTLSFAYSVGKMKELNNLVKRLESCETMGSANNILSDKTGTLTKNQMELVALCTEGKIFNRLDYKKLEISQNNLNILCIAICENSTAFLEIDPKTNLDLKKIGNPTECALLRFASKFGFTYQNYRNHENQIILFPFNSTRKRMTKVIQLKKDLYRVLFKGAPESIQSKLSSVLTIEGVAALGDSQAQIIQKAIMEFSANALRSVMLAYKDISKESYDAIVKNCGDDLEQIEKTLFSDLIFIGLGGIADPVREDVAESIRKCHSAGVKVRMVTGDSLATAKSIALELGIVNQSEIDENNLNYKKYAIMTGKEFFDLIGGIQEKQNSNPELKKTFEIKDINKFNEIVSQLKVLARSLPEHKFALVTGLRNDKNNVVAVTGDGTNDAMALKSADIGFAMGITGTEIAKEAAGIILLDDNFSSIIVALLWGRNILLSIRKFIQFQFTVNIVAVYTVLIGSLFLPESPLTSVQMLWVNLIMDTLGALALATECPANSLLKDKPSLKSESIITKMMWKNILSQAFFQIAIITILIFFPNLIFNVKVRNHLEPWTKKNGIHQTIIFNTFVFLQLFNEINSRKIGSNEFNAFKNILSNFYFLFIISITSIIQIVLISFGGYALKCSPLSLKTNSICIGLASLSLIIGVISKFIPDHICFCTLKERTVKYEEVYDSIPKQRFLTAKRKLKNASEAIKRMTMLKAKKD